MNQSPPLAGAATLTHWGVIRARGADAAKFLHSQLTSDLAMLSLTEARLAGFCSAKGRLQASFVVWKPAHDELLLACAASVLAATLKRLSMFVLRAQCKLSDATLGVPLRGWTGEAALALLGDARVWDRREIDAGSVIRLPDAAGLPRALFAANGVDPSAAWPVLPLDHWRWLEIQSGVPTIEAGTVDRFVPQMLNFELIGGVDFQKGCYPGQEVVARSQYRGTIKRRMFLFDVDTSASPGQEIFHSGDPGQPAGMVANAAPRPDATGTSLLAEIKLATLDAGSLHLGAPEGPLLQRRALPYALPIEAAESA